MGHKSAQQGCPHTKKDSTITAFPAKIVQGGQHMAWPSWDDYWDIYLAGGLLAVVILQLVHHKLTDRTPKRLTPEEATVTGLPFYTEPSYWRFLLAMPVFVFGTIFVAVIFQGAPFWLRILAYLPVYGFALLILAGWGIKKKQAAWERDDKVERQIKVSAAAQLARQEDDRRKFLEAEASFPDISATLPTSSPIDITDAAKALAAKLR